MLKLLAAHNLFNAVVQRCAIIGVHHGYNVLKRACDIVTARCRESLVDVVKEVNLLLIDVDQEQMRFHGNAQNGQKLNVTLDAHVTHALQILIPEGNFLLECCLVLVHHDVSAFIGVRYGSVASGIKGGNADGAGNRNIGVMVKGLIFDLGNALG